MKDDVNHLDDEIELYVLGMLPDDARLRIDAHANVCGECSQRLGRAETAMAVLVDASLAQETGTAVTRGSSAAPAALVPRAVAARQTGWRSRTRWAAVAAASFALVAGSLVQQNAALRSGLDADGSAFHFMLHSHFRHAQFTTLAGTPIAAKVIYESNGGWYEVLASGIDPESRVAVVRGTTVSEVADRFARRDDIFTLPLPAFGKISELRLLDARGRVVAHVRPVFPAGEKSSR